MATPVTLDLLSRFMAGVYDEKVYVKERTGFQSFFGRPETGAYTVFSPNANDIDIEIIRANQRLAALLPRGSTVRPLGSTHADMQIGQATFFSRKFLLTEEEGNISADQINNRIPGEGPYENLNREERFVRLAVRLHQENIRRHVRLQEFLATQSVTAGKQAADPSLSITAGNYYDYRRNSSNTVTATHSWGNSAGVPLTDIDAGCDQVLYAGKLMPDMLIVGGTANLNFLANSQVSTNYANKLYFDLLQYSLDFKPSQDMMRFVQAGFVPYGRLRTPKGYNLVIFTYPYVYDNSSGNSTKYFNDNYAMVIASGARCDRYFGPPEQIPLTAQDTAKIMERFGFNPAVPAIPVGVEQAEGTIVPQAYYVDAFDSVDRKHVTLRTQAAPIFATTMTDCFYTISNAGGTS